MWLIAEYQPTTLFSLKPAWATSSGGKSMLLPTPYAIKMALLDAVCRVESVKVAEEVWSAIRDLNVALRGSERIVVTNTFTKILKPRRGEAVPGSAHVGPYQKTIGFREYIFHPGSVGVGLQINEETAIERLTGWLLQINYLGKRGGFVQLIAPPRMVEALPDGFIPIVESNAEAFSLNGIVHQFDDIGPKVSFEQVNIYSGKNITLGKDRVLRHVILPYRLVRSSKSYSYYQRID
jgi:hypothetical protein